MLRVPVKFIFKQNRGSQCKNNYFDLGWQIFSNLKLIFLKVQAVEQWKLKLCQVDLEMVLCWFLFLRESTVEIQAALEDFNFVSHGNRGSCRISQQNSEDIYGESVTTFFPDLISSPEFCKPCPVSECPTLAGAPWVCGCLRIVPAVLCAVPVGPCTSHPPSPRAFWKQHRPTRTLLNLKV